MSSSYQQEIQRAVTVLNNGGVIAYPTEFCFGLGCDPRNPEAMQALLNIKQRSKDQGVILIAADIDQVDQYAPIEGLEFEQHIRQSWPGANTWILPCAPSVSSWVRGQHQSIAMRIPDHEFCRDLCAAFGHPIVSTSANKHGHPSLTTAVQVVEDLGEEIDHVVDLPVGNFQHASIIRDAMTGERLR